MEKIKENISLALSKTDTLIKVLRGQIITAIFDFIVLHPAYEPDQDKRKIPVNIPLKDVEAFEKTNTSAVDCVPTVLSIEISDDSSTPYLKFEMSTYKPVKSEMLPTECKFDDELNLEELRTVLKSLAESL